jgi:putative ABC transport system permease protein
MSFIALLMSLAIVEWIMPHYGVLTGKDFSNGINLTLKIIGILLSIGLATGFLAGIYPALQLSRFNPVQILGDKINLNEYSALPRKILVTAQTALSISLVIVSLGIYKHYKHIVTLNLGFDYKNVLVINVEHSPLTYYFDDYRKSLMEKEGIVNVTGFNYVPGVEHNIHPYLPEGFGSNSQQFYPAIQVKSGFFDTYNIKFKAGTGYDQSSIKNGIIINEAMVHYLGWGNCNEAIGKRFDFGHKNNRRIIIGVTEDFNVTSLHDTIVPFVVDKVTQIPNSAFFTKFIAVRFEPGNYDVALQNIKELWNLYHDNIDIEYRQHEDILLDLYESERILSSLIYIFTIIAIVIAILGMLGLSSFLTEQRTREIGVRKANGATSLDILNIILKEYTILGVLSIFVAWPIAFSLITYITKDIVYRTNVGIPIYLYASVLSAVIIGVTVVIQSLNASNKNPADALRYE